MPGQLLAKMASGQDGFAGVAAFVGDIQEFAQEDQPDDSGQEKDEEEGAQDQDKEDAKPAAEAEQTKRPAWFDRDSKLASATERHRKTLSEMKSLLESQDRELQQHLASQHVDHFLVQGWVAKGHVVSVCLQKVLSEDDDAEAALDAHIEQIQVEAKYVPSSSSASASDRKKSCGPPCSKYASLIVFPHGLLCLRSLMNACQTWI